MPDKKPFDRKHWSWISVLLVHVLVIATFLAWPAILPETQGQSILAQAGPYDVIVIYNPGGWGNATLEESTDFLPILLKIQETLQGLGYSSLLLAYYRSAGGFAAQITDLKQTMIGFPDIAQIQARDITFLTENLPHERILLVGFSNGGGLAARTMEDLNNPEGVFSIVAGTAYWYETDGSPISLVLNNERGDVLAAGDVWGIFTGSVAAPFRLIHARLTGDPMAVGLSLQYSGHEYLWSSPLVGPPIVEFLTRNFPPANEAQAGRDPASG
jgi:pimeloyl-ACP methyl ester carboxylesterase